MEKILLKFYNEQLDNLLDCLDNVEDSKRNYVIYDFIIKWAVPNNYSPDTVDLISKFVKNGLDEYLNIRLGLPEQTYLHNTYNEKKANEFLQRFVRENM